MGGTVKGMKGRVIDTLNLTQEMEVLPRLMEEERVMLQREVLLITLRRTVDQQVHPLTDQMKFDQLNLNKGDVKL